jgi:hypothetical protein
VNAQQCVEPTGPNRSIGLISILLLTIAMRRVLGTCRFASQRGPASADAAILLRTPQVFWTHSSSGHKVFWLDDLVIIARGPTPDPIPNSAVKSLCANGTASQDAGESVVARSSNQSQLPSSQTTTHPTRGGAAR